MKPRSKEQSKLAEWSNSFPALTPRQWKYAKEHLYGKQMGLVFTNHSWLFCPDTNKVWKGGKQSDVKKFETIKSPLHTNNVEKRVIHGSFARVRYYFMLLTTKGGYQAARWFLIERNIKVVWEPVVRATYRYWITECGTEWLTPKGKTISVEKPRCTMSRYVDLWRYGAMEVRGYDLFAEYCEPSAVLVQSVLPVIRRNGWNMDIMNSLNPRYAFTLMVGLVNNPVIEMCVKCGHTEVVNEYLRDYNYQYRHLIAHNAEVSEDYKQIIKMANRKHIKLDNPEFFADVKDHFRDLKLLHMDIHNPDVVFPKNFQEAHLRINKRAQKVREERERRAIEERHLRDMLLRANDERTKEWIYKYTQMFGNLDIKDGHFEILPLITTQDFREEAKHQHHCIETYYGKQETLLLSISHDGEKAETAEISLVRDGYLVQCRGKYNQPSKWHKHIVELLEGYMDVFIKRYRDNVNAKRRIGLPVPMDYYTTYKIA